MKDQIIDTAIKLIETDDPTSFSVAKVAKELGISQGNLTYYYPKREDLIEAVVGRLILKYTSELKIDTANRNGDLLSGQVLQYLLHDALQPATLRTTLFLWNSALTNSKVAELLANLYQTIVAEHLKLSGYYESQQQTKARHALLTIATIINGIIPILGITKSQFELTEYADYLQSLLGKLMLD